MFSWKSLMLTITLVNISNTKFYLVETEDNAKQMFKERKPENILQSARRNHDYRLSTVSNSPVQKPNIVFIMADDMGYNDIGLHNPIVKTPHLDSFARRGLTLKNAYVQPMCTPTRSALLTGLYPYRYGRQGEPLSANSPTGLTLNHRLMPEYLKNIGYKTHMIGKWHLGFCKKEFLPTRRGFDTFQGFWSAYQDFTTKVAKKFNFTGEGYDFHYNEELDESASKIYSADLYAQRAERVIKNHVESGEGSPLFLYIAHQAPHSPLSAPKKYVDMYKNVQSRNRTLALATITAMDASIGSVIQSLTTHNLINNTIVVFTSDNGGETIVGTNNWPLRGEKATVWEGGVRSPTLALVPNTIPGSTVNNLVHVTDWLPTFLRAAGQSKAEISKLGLDGVSQWNVLMNPHDQIWPRSDIVININKNMQGQLSAGYRRGNFKLVINPGSGMDWVPAPEGNQSAMGDNPPDEPSGAVSDNDIVNIDDWHDAVVNKTEPTVDNSSTPLPDEYFLFNIKDDPAERHNLASYMPSLMADMIKKVEKIKVDMVENDNPSTVDKGIENGVWVTGWC